jgi:ADP-heptose:LPS heptosyltransferase
LIWPLLRALARRGEVAFAARASFARVAAVVLGCRPVDIEDPRFTRLWTGDPPPPGYPPWPGSAGVRRVVSFLFEPEDPASQPWLRTVHAAFPNALIDLAGPPGSASRAALWEREAVAAFGAAPLRWNPRGPVVIHAGAGSATKRWTLASWATLRQAIATTHPETPCIAVAGEVEAEQWTAPERGRFHAALDGRFVARLDDLAGLLSTARVFVGADTGPTHLAAQLGVPTLALFGPTSPAVWSPVGPRVVTLTPRAAPAPMEHLAPSTVVAAVERLLAETPPQ